MFRGQQVVVAAEGAVVEVAELGARYQYLRLNRPPEPTVEIGGQVMTERQLHAARHPLATPAPGPTSLRPPTENEARAAATEAHAPHDAARSLRNWAAALDRAAEANP